MSSTARFACRRDDGCQVGRGARPPPAPLRGSAKRVLPAAQSCTEVTVQDITLGGYDRTTAVLPVPGSDEGPRRVGYDGVSTERRRRDEREGGVAGTQYDSAPRIKCLTVHLLLVQAIEDYLAVYNDDPKPFVWTKSADDILASLKSYCERITDTGH